jgi:hypothetical protein
VVFLVRREDGQQHGRICALVKLFSSRRYEKAKLYRHRLARSHLALD